MASRYNLGFISDEDIFLHVKKTVGLYRTSRQREKSNNGKVDPIQNLFNEKVSGPIALLHQDIFRHAGNGWEVTADKAARFDVQNPSHHLYAILQDGHETMSANKIRNTIINLQDKILNDQEAVCMLVEYNADTSRDEKWTVTSPIRNHPNDRVRLVSIDKFYNMVFEDKGAFERLCDKLPMIIDEALTAENGQANA